jgi:hypothetical protein
MSNGEVLLDSLLNYCDVALRNLPQKPQSQMQPLRPNPFETPRLNLETVDEAYKLVVNIRRGIKGDEAAHRRLSYTNLR